MSDYWLDEEELCDGYAGLAESVGSQSYDEAHERARRSLAYLLACAWAEGLASAEYDHETGRIVPDIPNPYREKREIMTGSNSDHYKTCEIYNLGGHVCPGCGEDIPHKEDGVNGVCNPCDEEWEAAHEARKTKSR